MVELWDSVEPFLLFYDWMRSYPIRLWGYTFTFMDVFVWAILATFAIWLIRKFIY